MTTPQSEEDHSPLWASPWLVWSAFGILVAWGLFQRAFLGLVPGDLSAYLSAADVFLAGADPYSEVLRESERYGGFPYIYLPGTLFLTAPLGFLPSAVVACLEWLARFAVLLGILKVMQRKIVPEMSMAMLALIALLQQPLWIDHWAGNIAIYLMGAWAVCLELSDRRESWGTLLGAFLCGIVIAFKPYWLIPAGWVLFSRGKYRSSAALVAGTAGVLSLSFALPEFLASYWVLNGEMRAFYQSVNWLDVAPVLYAVLFVAGVGGALWFARKYPSRWVYMLGCVSMPIWPRLSSYSYVLTLPWTLYLVRRWGLGRGLAFSAVTIGPLPWILRDSTLLPEAQVEGWAFLVWTMVSVAVCGYLLIDESRRAVEPARVRA